MYNKHPKQTGVYQIRDNIEQLQLMVHVRHVSSLLELPTSVDLISNQKKNDQSEAGNICSNTTKTHIHWQEKLLSSNELELYKKACNCTNETQKRYHQWLVAVGSPRVGQTDSHIDIKSKSTKTTKARGKKSSAKPAKQRKLEIPPNTSIYTYVQADNFTPTDDQVKDEKVDSALMEGFETMYIYLEPNVQLACLRWHPTTHVLQIYPDFNAGQDNPYFVKDTKSTDSRLYAYILENVSTQREIAEQFGLEIALPLQWQLDDELSNKFNMPPKHQRRVTLLFEIHAVNDCEYDGVHVRYQTQLPNGAVLESGRLMASTHTASASNGQLAGQHHFGHVWQLTLLCDEHCQEIESLLHIYFQVISIDSWERERIEGYAHYSTRLTPGHTTVHLQCMRPVDGFWDALARYFIGGRRQFDYVRFFTPQSTDDGVVVMHNRLGCRMQNTAQLTFSCQRLTQHSPALLQPLKAYRHNHTLDDIMLAYQTARRKLEALLLK